MTEQDGPRAPAELYQELVIAMTRAIEEPTEDNDRLADMVVEKVRVAEFKAALEAGKYDDVPAELREAAMEASDAFLREPTEENKINPYFAERQVVLIREKNELEQQAPALRQQLVKLAKEALVTAESKVLEGFTEAKMQEHFQLWTLVEAAKLEAQQSAIPPKVLRALINGCRAYMNPSEDNRMLIDTLWEDIDQFAQMVRKTFESESKEREEND
jgi:hypothetical protein